jgi:hypothetical protein
VDKSSVPDVRFVLYRVHGNRAQTFVSEHPSFEEGWSEGQHAVYLDKEGAYSLYRGDRRVAKFAHSRLMVRGNAVDLISTLV